MARVSIPPPRRFESNQFNYGFVDFYRKEDAEAAIEALNGYLLHGLRIRVELGNKRDAEIRSHQSCNSGSYKNGTNQNRTDWIGSNSEYEENLQTLKSIVNKVQQNPIVPDDCLLLDASQLSAEINKLYLSLGPSFGQQRPTCGFDLDVLDPLAEKFWKEKEKENSSTAVTK